MSAQWSNARLIAFYASAAVAVIALGSLLGPSWYLDHPAWERIRVQVPHTLSGYIVGLAAGVIWWRPSLAASSPSTGETDS